jgi:hypothetical protein
MDTGAAAAQNAAANNFVIGAGVVEKDLVGACGASIFFGALPALRGSGSGTACADVFLIRRGGARALCQLPEHVSLGFLVGTFGPAHLRQVSEWR